MVFVIFSHAAGVFEKPWQRVIGSELGTCVLVDRCVYLLKYLQRASTMTIKLSLLF